MAMGVFSGSLPFLVALAVAVVATGGVAEAFPTDIGETVGAQMSRLQEEGTGPHVTL